MAQETMHYSIEKVKALKVYFLRLRNGSRGTPECSDFETSVKLCEQLIALMEPPKGGKP